MNAILSLFLSFAMLFTGGALPATVEDASTLTIQDFVLSYNDESYPLGYSLSVTAAAAQDELGLHLEVLSEDGEVLLPLSGRMTQDGVTFAIAEEGSAYTISAETLMEMLGMEEDDVSYIEEAAEQIASYIGAVSALEESQTNTVSVETRDAMLDVLYANMQDMISEEIAWDFGNGEIDALHVNGVLSGMDLYKVLDGWLALDDEMLAPAMQQVLDVFNTIFSMNYAVISADADVIEIADAASIGVIGGADGPTAVYVSGEEYAPAENFTQLIELLSAEDETLISQLESTQAEMDILSGMEGETAYQSVNLYMNLDESMGAALNVNADTAASPENSEIYFGMYLEQGSDSIGYEVQALVDGPMENPASVDLEMMIQNNSVLDFTDYDAEELIEDLLYTTNTMYVSGGYTYEDDLQDASLVMQFTESGLRYVDGEYDEEDDTSSVYLDFYMDEEKEEDGSLVSIFDINLSINDEENMGVSFSTVLSKAAAQDYFAGMNAAELPADGEDPAYESLAGDAMLLLGDLMTISSDENILALTELFSGESYADNEEYYDAEDYDEEYYEDEDYDEEYGEYEEDYDAYYEQYSQDEDYEGEDYTFLTLEEAAEVFAGNLIGYTAPEGYEIESVYVTSDGSYLNANYYNEDGYYISLNQNCYEDDSGFDFFAIENGAVSLLDSYTAEVYRSEADTGYYYAEIALPDGSLSVYFDDCDAETAQNILAGLEF